MAKTIFINDRIMKLKKGSIALLTLAGMFYMSVQKADACTRAVYIGPDNMVITGRTMDWKEDIMSNIYICKWPKETQTECCGSSIKYWIFARYRMIR